MEAVISNASCFATHVLNDSGSCVPVLSVIPKSVIILVSIAMLATLALFSYGMILLIKEIWYAIKGESNDKQ